MDYAVAALIISLLTLAMNIGLAVFGGGRGLSDRFGAMAKSVTADIAELRKEVNEKQDRSENNVGDALRGMREHIHTIEKAVLEFRVLAAETFMRRDSYYKASDELKREVNSGFEKMEKRLERMEGKIDYDRKEDHGR
jgi:exonuclease VII large subunit